MADKKKPEFEELLKKIPGARRAAQGIIIPTGDGGFFHAVGIFDKETTDGLSNEEQFFLAFCSKNEIIRLRELHNAHDYLLRLRAHAIVDEARACRVFRSRRHSQADWSLTKYYHSREAAKNEYLGNLTRSNNKILKRIPAGLGLARQANALCVRSFLGDVIFVSEALESFYYFMNLAFADKRWQITDADRAAALAIAVRVMLGSESLDFDLDRRGEIPVALERELIQKTKDQLAFTYGHEYAHHLCAHLSSAEVTELRMSSHVNDARPESTEHVVKYSHEIEYEADLFAVKNVSCNAHYQNQLTAAGFWVFIFLDFLEPYLKMFQGISHAGLDTHPQSIDRLWHLRDKLKPHIGPSRIDIESTLRASASNHSALKHLIADQGPRILEFYGSIYLPGYKTNRGVDRIDY